MKDDTISQLMELEARLDAVLFARTDQSRNERGEYNKNLPVIFGREKSYIVNPKSPKQPPNQPKGAKFFVDTRIKRRPIPKFIPDERDIIDRPQMVKGAMNEAKKINKQAGRVGRTIRDASDVVRGKGRRKDLAGRKKKREWEKPYFQRGVAAVGTTAALLAAGKWARNNPAKADKIIGKGGSMLRGGVEAVKRPVRKFFNAKGKLICFEDTDVVDDRGRKVFRVSEVRGNSARIIRGDKPKRDRRQKKWHEKVENERKLWKAGVVGGVAGGILIGKKGGAMAKGIKGGFQKIADKLKRTKMGQGMVNASNRRQAKRKIDVGAKDVFKRGGVGLS